MSVYLSSQKIIKDWIDYNDHMNVSYYLLIFDKYGADTLNNIFKMGEHSAKTTGKSTMIVESNITYNQELKVDDEVDVNLEILFEITGNSITEGRKEDINAFFNNRFQRIAFFDFVFFVSTLSFDFVVRRTFFVMIKGIFRKGYKTSLKE